MREQSMQTRRSGRALQRLGWVAIAAMLATTGCATAGATFRSGVGDAHLEHPPWVAGASLEQVRSDTTRIGHLPIGFQRGATQPGIFDPSIDAASPLGQLLAEMNAYLDSLGTASGMSVRLVAGGQVSAVASRATTTPPDVQFGCMTEGNLPGEDCVARGDSALGRGPQRMRLAVGRPSSDWIAWNQEIASANDVERTLVLTLEIGDYLMRQRGLRGTKEVELGTGNTQKLPWLTSLETPVSVLQLTGALVGLDGKAIRIGSEGFYAKRTRLTVSALRAQELLRDQEVAEARSLRRDDLYGSPLAWQVAMRNLIAHLTGRGDIAQPVAP